MCQKCVTDLECDECGAGAGERCTPHCTAPYGPGGPHENDAPDEDEGREPGPARAG